MGEEIMSHFRKLLAHYSLNDPSKVLEIEERIKKLLTDKEYLWVESYEYKDWRPDIHPKQRMTSISTYPGAKDSMGLSVADYWGSWGFVLYEKKVGYIEFFSNGLQVYQLSIGNKGMWWQIYIEDEDD
jgi:hypothetical protein